MKIQKALLFLACAASVSASYGMEETNPNQDKQKSYEKYYRNIKYFKSAPLWLRYDPSSTHDFVQLKGNRLQSNFSNALGKSILELRKDSFSAGYELKDCVDLDPVIKVIEENKPFWQRHPAKAFSGVFVVGALTGCLLLKAYSWWNAGK